MSNEFKLQFVACELLDQRNVIVKTNEGFTNTIHNRFMDGFHCCHLASGLTVDIGLQYASQRLVVDRERWWVCSKWHCLSHQSDLRCEAFGTFFRKITPQNLLNCVWNVKGCIILLECCWRKVFTLLGIRNDDILLYDQIMRCIYRTRLGPRVTISPKKNGPITRVTINSPHTVTCNDCSIFWTYENSQWARCDSSVTRLTVFLNRITTTIFQKLKATFQISKTQN